MLVCVAWSASAAGDDTHAPQEDERAVLQADAAFWDAYNRCDMTAAADLLTGDVEFYHDRTGLTTSRAALVDSLRKGPCASTTMRLRREAVDGSLAFHPLAGGYALLSGQHRFHVTDAGKPERLDGQADFQTIWKSEDGRWRMHRVVSYGHGPVPYVPPAPALMLSPAELARFSGRYRSARIGDIRVAVDGDHLTLTAGAFVATLYPESADRFFAVEKDLRFTFLRGTKGRIETLAVHENGEVTEGAVRQD